MSASHPKQAYTTSTAHALLCSNLTLFFGLGALDPIHWGTSRTNFHRLSAAAISNWQLERDFPTTHGTEHLYMSLIGPWVPPTHYFVEPWMSSKATGKAGSRRIQCLHVSLTHRVDTPDADCPVAAEQPPLFCRVPNSSPEDSLHDRPLTDSAAAISRPRYATPVISQSLVRR